MASQHITKPAELLSKSILIYVKAPSQLLTCTDYIHIMHISEQLASFPCSNKYCSESMGMRLAINTRVFNSLITNLSAAAKVSHYRLN